MADVRTQERSLEREISATVERSLPQVEVLAVELVSPTRFCVYVDHPRGVDHGLCERVTGVLRPYLDRFTVDVSSPGLERPLRKPAHFANAVGRPVAVRTAEGVEGRRRFRGQVERADDTAVTLRLDDMSVALPYDAIVRANLIDEG